MNRYEIALGKKPPEKPLDEAMRRALDEPTTTAAVFIDSVNKEIVNTGMVGPLMYPRNYSPLLLSSYNFKRIPATGD